MNKTHGNTTRGMRGTPAYISWDKMKQRCTNPKTTNYKYYGGRGITVCNRWNYFENFLADMGKRPSGLTLDRINNNGSYTPSNCRWATRKQQAANRRAARAYRLSCKNKTGTTGVFFNKAANKYQANLKGICLGRFVKKEDAINARKKAEKENEKN